VDRIRGPLFGTSSGNLSGKITLPVITADEDGTVQLLGGFSLGFGIGTELVPAQKPASGSAVVRLKIVRQTPGKSTAETLTGDTAKFAPGMLFVVDRWAPSGKGLMALWVPPADLSVEELKRVAEGVNKLRGVAGITVVDDPYEVTPTHIISWNGTAWVLTDQNTQAVRTLGRTPDLLAVAKGLAGGSAKIFVNLPLPKEAGAGVAALTGGPSPVKAVTSIREANYLLVGRATPNGIDYAWLLPGASKDVAAASGKKSGAGSAAVPTPPASSLPPETRWVAAQTGSKTFETAITELTELAGNLSRINGWLSLPSPADDGGFPYHLVIYESKHADAPEPVATTIGDGRSYGLELKADPNDLKRLTGPRRVYIFVIDSDGNGVPVFPSLDTGDVANVHPTPLESRDGIPAEIKLGPVELFTVGKPFGTDTYFMLTTGPQDSINLASLGWEGVRGEQRGAESPLDQLLSSVGTRSPRPVTPSTWSITKMAVHSQPAP
jgi:hypothetical protein